MVGRVFDALDADCDPDSDLIRVKVVSPKVAVIGAPVEVVTTSTEATVAVNVATILPRACASAVANAENPAVTASICLSLSGWAAEAAPARSGTAAKPRTNLFIHSSLPWTLWPGTTPSPVVACAEAVLSNGEP